MKEVLARLNALINQANVKGFKQASLMGGMLQDELKANQSNPSASNLIPTLHGVMNYFEAKINEPKMTDEILTKEILETSAALLETLKLRADLDAKIDNDEIEASMLQAFLQAEDSANNAIMNQKSMLTRDGVLQLNNRMKQLLSNRYEADISPEDQKKKDGWSKKLFAALSNLFKYLSNPTGKGAEGAMMSFVGSIVGFVVNMLGKLFSSLVGEEAGNKLKGMAKMAKSAFAKWFNAANSPETSEDDFVPVSATADSSRETASHTTPLIFSQGPKPTKPEGGYFQSFVSKAGKAVEFISKVTSKAKL